MGELIGLAIIVVMVVAIWKIFEKAGKPGWASLIPFYNVYIMLEIAGKPGWWLVLYLIPVINFIMMIIVTIAFAAKFGNKWRFCSGTDSAAIYFLPDTGF